ncbi:MAG: hypothetical protein V7K50_04460 [Nostoc sp.]
MSYWGLGIGDWGLGIGDWGLGMGMGHGAYRVVAVRYAIVNTPYR